MTRSVLRWLAPVAATLALAASAAGCGGGGEQALPVLDDLSLVADATAQAESARFELGVELTVPGVDDPIGFAASGGFADRGERASLAIDLGDFVRALESAFAGMGGQSSGDLPDPDELALEVVLDRDVVYLNAPFLAGELPDGKTWVRVSLEDVARLQGTELGELQSFVEGGDPRELLDALKAVSGELDRVGVEDVRGVETTHYRATIDWADYANAVGGEQAPAELLEQVRAMVGLDSIPVDVWVDADGYLRRFELSVGATPPGQTERFEASIDLELFDYGSEVAVEPPAAEDVVDMTELQPGS